jgi:ribA/ribD-fused uncharacterized protein
MQYTKIIGKFRGDYRWLSNFYIHDEENQLAVEHHYLAAKTTNVHDYRAIITAGSPANAKKISKTLPVRYDWDEVKLTVMEHLIREKFGMSLWLERKLRETEGALIVEGNTWGDKFWGVCDGEGENHLGKIIMRVRDEWLQ